MRYLVMGVVIGVLGAQPLPAQEVRATRVTLVSGPCTLSSGPGSPEGAVAGKICDTYWRTDATTAEPIIYRKTTATGSSGWVADVQLNAANVWTAANRFTVSIATPFVYADTSKALSLGGTGVAGCGAPPSAANCEAASLSVTAAFFEQRLPTNAATRTQWYVGADGGYLTAYNASGWLPLRLFGGPVEISGGGLYVGRAASGDPGFGNALLDGYVGSPGYASQTTGWRVTGAGAGDFRYLYTDEMHAKKFIADLEQALAGGQIIAKSVGQVGAEFTVPAGGSIATLTMKDLPSAPNMAIFEAGDWVRIRTFSRAAGSLSITDAWGTVSGYADQADGLQTWNFTRALSTAGGAMTTGQTIPIDSIVLDYGVSGNGFYEVNAIDGLYGINSPYAQVVTWAGSSPVAANQVVRSRWGNLKGVGPGTWGWGLFTGDYANGRYGVFSDQLVELHGVPLSLWNGSTRVLYADPVTPYWAMGAPAPSSYSTGTGCWSGMDAGVFKWRCGDISGGTQYIAWNGTQLQVAGNIVVTGTSIDAATVTGVAGATVVSGAARGLLGIDANGNPLLPHTVTPSGDGLYLGSDHLGYYGSGAWKTYMDSSGGFYLGGASGALQWDGSTLAINGNVTITGGSGYANLSDKPTLGALAAKSTAAWATDISGIPATLGTPTGTGLFLSSTALGYYTGGTWMTYMDNAGRFYLGGTSGKLRWDGSALAIEGTVNATAGYFGSSSSVVAIDASGLDIGTSGSIRGGATSYSSGTGVFLGYDGGYKFRVGNPSGQRVQWDGSNLGIYGANFELSAAYGLRLGSASGDGDYTNMLSWAGGGEIGSNGYRTWVWGPGGTYAMAAYTDHIDFMNSGGYLLRASDSAVTVWRDLLPGDLLWLGSPSVRWNGVFSYGLNVDGTITFPAMGGGGTRFVCVDYDGVLFPSSTACDLNPRPAAASVAAATTRRPR